MALTKIDDRGLKTPVDLLDNEKIRFGTGNDLEIYHDGSHSVLKEAGTGDLRIQTASFRLRNEDASEMMISADGNGAVYLAYNGTTKLQTYSDGVEIHGDFWLNNQTNAGKDILFDESSDLMRWKDSVKATFGDGDDLQIYHDGSNSYIEDAGTGELRIRGTTIRLTDHDGSENFANFNDDGAVELFYDNVKKFETQSGGVRVYGDLENHNDDFVAKDNCKFTAGNSADLEIYHDGSHSYINESGTGNLKIKSSRVDILNPAGDEDMIVAVENGEVELFYDGSKKLATHSGGVSIHGHCSLTGADSYEIRLGAGSDLKIFHDGSNSHIHDNGTGALKIRTNELQLLNAAGDEYFLSGVENGAVGLYHDNAKVIETHGAGIKVGVVGSTQEIWFPDSNDADVGLIRYRHDEDWMSFFTWGSERFRIEDNGDLLAHDTTIGLLSSDNRLKKNVADYNYDLTKFKQLKPRTFEWKNTSANEHPTGTQKGFIAQEVETVDTSLTMEVLVDEANTADRALLDADGKSKSTKLGGHDALYVSVIQQLITKIETLETKVAALEAA